MNSTTPRTDNLVMALKCVPDYAKSRAHDFEMAIAKCRELELELADCQAGRNLLKTATWNEALEAALLKTPGGSICDPQEVADQIRALMLPNASDQRQPT